jgi:hypothetical protein
VQAGLHQCGAFFLLNSLSTEVQLFRINYKIPGKASSVAIPVPP